MTLRLSRFTTLTLCILVALVAIPLAFSHPWLWLPGLLALLLAALGAISHGVMGLGTGLEA